MATTVRNGAGTTRTFAMLFAAALLPACTGEVGDSAPGGGEPAPAGGEGDGMTQVAMLTFPTGQTLEFYDTGAVARSSARAALLAYRRYSNAPERSRPASSSIFGTRRPRGLRRRRRCESCGTG